MNTSHYPSQYNIQNGSPIQGQVIGEHNVIINNFVQSQAEKDLIGRSSDMDNHSQVSHNPIFHFNVPHLPNLSLQCTSSPQSC